MVEQTYNCYEYLKEEMIEDICSLKNKFNFWRPVLGDGNCFYRSVIFSWLEFIILNKKTKILEIFKVNLYKKLDKEYSNNNEFPERLKEQYFTEEKFVAIVILEIIIQNMYNNRIEDAYLTLIKVFNNTIFDRIMIFYLRYLIYEYIENNKDKLYSKNFPVLLGNLLPSQYETEDGKFLYKEYYFNDLLQYCSFAEKLPIYLIPYILKVNLNVVYYDYGKECYIRNKLFQCNLPNKDLKRDTINVLYRTIHYDICYAKEYYNEFKKYLDFFCKLIPELIIVNPNDIIQKGKNMIFNDKSSIIFSRKQQNKAISVKEKKEKYKNEKTESQIFNNLIIIYKICESHSLKNCFTCDKKLENYEIFKIKLSCKCYISFCSDECKKKYYECLVEFINSMEIDFNLNCGRCGKNITRITILNDLDNFINNENVRNALKNKMLEFYQKYCSNCLTAIKPNSKYNEKLCKCYEFNELLNTKKFEHKLCEECCKAKKNIDFCNLCNIYHATLKK